MAVAVGGTTSCAPSTPYFVAAPEPWRKPAELACLRSGVVATSAFVAPQPEVDGPSSCGAIQPFKMDATSNGAVELSPPALVQCAMVSAIDVWMQRVVIPAAHRHFGMGVARAKVLASYSCRPRNNEWGAKLSEHGHANAIDIGGFTLVDGRTISVLSGWNGGGPEQAFLREVHRQSCRIFSTVLGPNSDRNHRNHFHLDLAHHNRRGSHYCR